MTNAFQSNVDIAGTAWKDVPTATMELYYAEFEKGFTWDGNLYSQPVIYRGWYAQASKAYSDHLCRVKRLIKKKKTPTYILPPVKDAWMAYWARPDVQARSEQASKNRKSEPAGVGTGMAIHHGGSRSAFDHRDHLAREKNIPVENATLDTFMQLHYKDGQYTHPLAKAKGEEIQRRLLDIQSTQGRDVTPQEVDAVFRDVVKRDKKGRMLGLGMMSQTMGSTGSCSHSTGTSAFQPGARGDPVEIDELRSQVSAQAQQIADMQRQMATVMQLVARGTPTGFTPSSSDATGYDLDSTRP